MAVMLLTLVVMLLIVGGMAIGVLLGRTPIKGSCGGLGALGMKSACDICGGSKEQWQREAKAAGAEALSYDATKKV
ncbi:MAG TPA: (Na+)-NQR maturation NqrM [Spongiibacteraceae bacterium]|jgi:hypothetical protein|nr:(Na+)-NQR maturation NqrM [Spongiibacteraceae bacterium]HUH38541.1 (Na+)-NQR maturation NqrM [Spongiibacteraceae bacterium]